MGGSVATKLPLASLNKRSALSRGPCAKNRQKPALYSTPSMEKAKRVGREAALWRFAIGEESPEPDE